MSWHSAYLVHGDDHGRIAERRANLRRKAEGEEGVGSIEVLEGDAATPQAVALTMSAMTFAMGRRFVVVDGVERWKPEDVKALVLPAMKTIGDDMTVAFFGRDEGRSKTPPSLGKAVEQIGGVVRREEALKAKDLPQWLVGEAGRLGLRLDRGAARVMVQKVGDRQQRLLRELEVLALEHGAGADIGVDEVEGTAPSAERQVWGFVDALVAGDRRAATRSYLQLRAQGEALPRLVPLMARRVRDVLNVAARLEIGETPAQVRASVGGPPWAVDKRIKEARAADPDRLRRAIESLAELELATRGLADLNEDTAALRAIDLIASAA